MSNFTSVFRSLVRPRRALRLGMMLALALAMGLQPLQPALAATFTVDITIESHDSIPGDGTCADIVGSCSLRAAIEEANALAGADVITLPAGTYTLTLGSELLVATEITINGAGAATTIVEANANPNTATYRVMEVSAAGNLTLSGVTVRNGRCNGSCAADPTSGGGIYNGGTLTLGSSTISSNSAVNVPILEGGSGGGIYNAGSLAVSDSIFSGNAASGSTGGGIYNGGTIMTVTNTAFSANSANGGGGVYNNSTIGALSNSTFSGNSANRSDGGSVHNRGTISTLSNSTFSGNSATSAGGVGGSGGGIYNRGTITTLTNSTFSGNSANVSGGGIVNLAATPPGIITTLSYTIVANNVTGGNCAGGVPSATVSSLSDSTGCFAFATTLVPGTDYDTTLADNGCVTPLPDGSCVKTHALLAGSSAINGASSGTAADERGFAAVGVRDIGAYEFIPSGSPAIGVTPTPFSFGSVAVGSNSSQTFTVENTGTADLTLDNTSAVSVTGAGFTRTGGTCANSTLLATSAACTVIVKFAPPAAGPFSGSLVVASDAASGSGTVALSGTGTMGSHAPVTLKKPKNGAAVIKQPIKLTWKGAKKPFTGYHVQVNTQSDFLGTSFADQDVLPKKPLFPIGGLPFGVYYWHVAVIDVTGTSAYSPTFSFEVTALKSPKKNATNRPTITSFSWQKTPGATYDIEVSLNPDMSSPFIQVLGLTKPSYKVQKTAPLSPGTVYYWRVRVNGVWTLPWQFTTK